MNRSASLSPFRNFSQANFSQAPGGRFGKAAALLLLCWLAACTTTPPPLPAPVPPPQAPQAAEAPTFTETGVASWYGAEEQGSKTASGERFDMHALTAAHRTLAFGTVARVTNLANGETVKVRINDRGPHIRSRIIDLSQAAAAGLGLHGSGTLQVKIEVFASDQR